MSSIKTIANMFEEKLSFENIQIINSSGNVAQQSVPHIHFHNLPRYNDDGQDIKWNIRLELHEQFDRLLASLKEE